MPQGKLTPISVEQRTEPTAHAAYARVICVDEVGALFYFDASAFTYDMKPYIPKDLTDAAKAELA